MDLVPPPTTEHSESRQERKVASILFADLVGFTGLNEANDPELVQAIVAEAFDRLSQEVARYEGLIEKFAGDAMLALFGVPQTHEDDAERAVRAALEMQAAMTVLADEARAAGRPELSLRVGIETGEVLVDQGRAAVERDRMVTGDAVNTAARLQTAAAPGTVVVGPGTYAATRAMVDFEELEPLSVKGKAQPVAAWRALAVKARRGGAQARMGTQAPLVGRDREMALLKETVQRMVADGRPHLVTVLGAAGVGKSRITWELEQYLDGLPDAFVWRKGRSLAYGQGSFGALAEMIRTDTGIREDDSVDEALRKLDQRLDALPWTFADPQRDVLRGVLAVRDVPQVGRDGLYDAMRRYLEALSHIAPAVLVFEDIHWADDGLLDVIESLARWGGGQMLILCLSRHELLEKRPSWSGGMPNATTIVLEALDAADNGRLLEGLMPGGLTEALRTRIVHLADGNPLFTEELVRMFVDRGVIRFAGGRWELAQAVDELQIPGSIQAVLAARLDALPDHEKRMAQDAAVVGRIFWDAVLAFLGGQQPARVDDLLRRLRVKELVIPREPSTLTGASEFSFRHVLIRDVAYESLPKRDRAAKHIAVAEWAEHQLADRTEELAELLASHCLSALGYREEFGASDESLRTLRGQTYRYARMATDRAGMLHDRAAATRWGRVALDVASHLELSPIERLEAANAFLAHGLGFWSAEEGEVVARAATKILAGVTDDSPATLRLATSITASHASTLVGLGRHAEARRVIEERLARMARGSPTGSGAYLKARLGWVLWRSDDPGAARPLLMEALAEARATGDRPAEAWAIHDFGIVESMLGDLVGGAVLVRESLTSALAVGDFALQLRAYANVGSVMMDAGAPFDEAEAILREGLASARAASARDNEGWLTFQLAEAAERQGRLDESGKLFEASIALAESVGDTVQLAFRQEALGWHYALQGDWDRSLATTSLPDDPDEAMIGEVSVWTVIWYGWRQWRTDPMAAVESTLRRLPQIVNDRSFGVVWLARMAYRTRDVEMVEAALEMLPVTPGMGPYLTACRRWIEALAGPEEQVVAILEEVDDDLRTIGYELDRCSVRADIALSTARLGDDATEAEAMVAELSAKCGMVPTLGTLPETRWIEAPGTPVSAER
ncbi:MAG: adenylate/guanylate cyclase domain-containing protein [Candidatus Limnocylindrales bacterium]